MTEWTTAWRSGDALNLRVETTVVDGRRRHRVVTGLARPDLGGDGAVVVCVRGMGNEQQVLLVRQYRVALDTDLWELPRGVADPTDESLVETGVREVAEETGLTAVASKLCGVFHPDSGTLGTTVGVVRAIVAGSPHPADREVDEVRWERSRELVGMIARGELRDGISLAALVISGVLGSDEPGIDGFSWD